MFLKDVSFCTTHESMKRTGIQKNIDVFFLRILSAFRRTIILHYKIDRSVGSTCCAWVRSVDLDVVLIDHLHEFCSFSACTAHAAQKEFNVFSVCFPK